MPLITATRLEEVFNVPVDLPATLLEPGSWLGVTSVELLAGSKLTLNELQLQIQELQNPDTTDECGTFAPHVINPNFVAGSLITVFLIVDWSPSSEPFLQAYAETLIAPEDFTTASTVQAPVFVTKTTTDYTTEIAGIYTVVILNNSTNRKVVTSLAGSMQIDAAPET